MGKIIKISEQQLERLKEEMANLTMMKNASPSHKDDGSMIQYWEQKTGINLRGKTWLCPKCGKRFQRADLDGSHVVYLYPTGNNSPQFITPLCQECNRNRNDNPIIVRREHIVPAP